MPKPGFASITIRAVVKERLERYARERGYATLSDAINALLDQATQCQAIMERLEELEALQRKTYLALLRLLEELAASRKEGPESPAGRGEGGDDVVGHSRAVKTAHPTYPPEAPRGRKPQSGDIG